MTVLRRHDWVWLNRDAQTELGALGGAEVLAHHRRGHPFVVARSLPDDAEGSLRLGLTLPGKRRFGFSVPIAWVRDHHPPTLLEALLPHLPPPWKMPLSALERQSRNQGLSIRVYGSAAWTAMTGLSHLRPESDLDVVIAVASRAEIAAALAVLAAYGEGSPRIDGELVRPDGLAAAWREAAADSPQLLVKSRHEAKIVDRTIWEDGQNV